MKPLKDEQLNALADEHNVAQFVSFGPGDDPRPRHQRVRGFGEQRSDDVVGAISQLFGAAGEQSINIRTFLPHRPKGNPFVYGVTSVGQAVDLVRKHAAEGYYTIVNETIDVDDGGVSGVVLGGVVEFAPGDTPRAVEKPGTVALPFAQALALLSTVYGFEPDLDDVPGERLEFSVHPVRVGHRNTHTLLWEREDVEQVKLDVRPSWPNIFSRLVGDKTFGLLIAAVSGLPVPRTVVMSRRLAPFEFGRPTNTGERWLRTAPPEPVPGHYTTRFGWSDPYELLHREDPDGSGIAAVLAQEAVDAVYSGATLPGDTGGDYVEGVAGRGDDFMLGQQPPDALPTEVVWAVRDLSSQVRGILGPVRLEWAFDGATTWVLQMHLSGAGYVAGVINPGQPDTWFDYDPGDGLSGLAAVIDRATAAAAGIRVVGPVGVTSHVGDVLRKAGIPARIDVRPVSPPA